MVEGLIAQMCERLGIEPPPVEVVDRIEGSPSATNGKRIVIGREFMQAFAPEFDAIWICCAHEVGHVYWEQRDDWFTALDGCTSKTARTSRPGSWLLRAVDIPWRHRPRSADSLPTTARLTRRVCTERLTSAARFW